MTQNRSQDWLDRIVRSGAVEGLCAEIERCAGSTGRYREGVGGPDTGVGVVVEGSRGSSTAILAGALAVRTGRPMLLVVAHPDEADDALDDLQLFAGGDHRVTSERFGAMEVLPGESAVNLELLAHRLRVVEKLAGGGAADVLVTPIQALMQAVPGPAAVAGMSFTVRAGQALAPGGVLDWLASSGYERVDAVEQPGQFAVRGGIVDIYPPAGLVARLESGGATDAAQEKIDSPVRLDFFGDTVDSITRVDPDTMGSDQSLGSVQMIGATVDQLQRDTDTVNLLSLLPAQTVVVLHEVLELSEQARGYYERLTNPRGVYPPQAVLKGLTSRLHVQVNQYGTAAQDKTTLRWLVNALESFDHNATEAVKQLARLVAGSVSQPEVVVLCRNGAERDRLSELLREYAAGSEATVRLELGYLHRGFVWDDDQGGGRGALYLVPHHELFHRYHTTRQARLASSRSAAGGRARDAFYDLQPGDFVVHVEHGIARFDGLRTMARKGRTEEYLTLTFAQDAKLHVPVSQIDLVQKYIGGFHGKPPLSQLGGRRWAKQKQQVAEAVKDLAAELLRVQAARASMPGICYPPDTVWQRKFEAEFPYEETQDQLAAIAAVKKDMCAARPMDRLICGDVGFGKTEIAVRAAFKAVEFGKQVAVLVPTTVLAEQHERTFRDRMADYPFRVASVSRFKTPGEAAKLLREVAQGRVDIIIGTHRLLSEDVKFADLGLVVIDEEQRFGVEHKHKLMRLRLTVDVLTLSATPIPRTLHMSMLGLRDISSLTTPPLDRRAIVTEVIPYDPRRVRQAIVREMNRDGQVYFVHNRVYDIQSVADEVHKLVPDARIGIGHGQMAGHELEEVMLAFLRREVDVLVCTTIIESGIDIPTVNTIFIDGADHFGLADLHQLRGRVGRYKHRAYCYLLLPEDRPITDTATRRLHAIEQYSMLGAGFKIAMRDLEIRGAGNLLGAQQSGHIAAVGYEMYCQLLEQAARRLRQEPVIEPAKTHLELPASGHLPKRYIPSDRHRMEAYRRLSRAVSLEELGAVAKDLTDAYGDAPPPVQQLLDLAGLRVAATLLDVEAIKLDGQDVIFRVSRAGKLDGVLRHAAGRVSVIDPETIYWRPPENYLEPATLLAVLKKMLVGAETTMVPGGRSVLSSR